MGEIDQCDGMRGGRERERKREREREKEIERDSQN